MSAFAHISSRNDPDYTFNYKTKTGTTTRGYSLSAMIGAGFRPGKRLEIRPAFGLLHYTSGYAQNDSAGEIRSSVQSSSQWGLAYELGFYFHLLDREFFGFSLGPEIYVNHLFTPTDKSGSTTTDYDSYYDLTIALGIPLNLDIKIARFFAFRLNMSLFNFTASGGYEKDTGTAFDRSHLEYDFDILTEWTPGVGFVFLF